MEPPVGVGTVSLASCAAFAHAAGTLPVPNLGPWRALQETRCLGACFVVRKALTRV